METDEGKSAVAPCSLCTREGTRHECKVFVGKDDRACAYCKRMGKSGCVAALEPVFSVEDRLARLEEENARLQRQNDGLVRGFAAMTADFKTIWEQLWPERPRPDYTDEDLRQMD